MAIDSYANLKTAIGDWLQRDDLGSYLDDFIDLTETLLKRRPVDPSKAELGGIRANLTEATGTLTAGTRTLALPSDFLEAERLHLTTATLRLMQPVSPEQINFYHRTGSGSPVYYTIRDVIEFDVNPDSAYGYSLLYWPSFSGLDSSTTTNWVLTNYPDCYLWGSLYHASVFVRDDDGSQIHAQRYKDAAWAAHQSYRRGRESQGALMIRPDNIRP